MDWRAFTDAKVSRSERSDLEYMTTIASEVSSARLKGVI